MIYAGICEKGAYRKENQDSILMRAEKGSGLFIVADGVGGSEDGSGASRLIAENYGNWWENVFLKKRRQDFFSLFTEIKDMAEQLNKELYEEHGKGKSCSTIVLLFIHKGIYGCLSAGDSRLYRCGRDGAKLITRDDTWENRPDADMHSIHTGKIISAVGGFERLEYSCITDRTRLGDVFLLCSDGIYKYVEDDFLESSMKIMYQKISLRKEMLGDIEKAAVEHDTRDNYSFIAVKVSFRKQEEIFLNMVDREELTGFRAPYESEKDGIEQYIRKSNAGILKAMAFWNAVCSVLAAGIILNLVSERNAHTWKETVGLFVFACGFTCAAFCIRAARKKKYRLFAKIARGDYRLMECRAYEVSFNMELLSEAVVKICNRQGQYCNDRFLIDIETAKECKEGKDIELLLLKCDDFYELLSYYRRGVEKK